VSLSEDGNVVAIGAPYNDGNGKDSGHVRVYEYNTTGGQWSQRGNDLVGEAASDIPVSTSSSDDGPAYEAAGDQSGWSVSLSKDGNVVAIGAPNNSNDNGPTSGRVRVFEWDEASDTWSQRGKDLDGEAAHDNSGTSVSLSEDGNVVAIGATGSDVNGKHSGHVRVYEYNTSGGKWSKRGNDFYGEAAYDYLGWSVSLSGDGNVVAMGAPMNDAGHVRVYEYNTSGSKWSKRGIDLVGEAAGDRSGTSVSLSEDGNVVAIGAPNNDSGYVRIHQWGG